MTSDSACERARSLGVPIVVLKTGRSEVGARAALAHSGSLAGDDALIDAALRRSGAIRVENPTELVSLLALQSGADFVLTRYLPQAGIFKGYLRLFEESDGRLVLYTRTGFAVENLQRRGVKPTRGKDGEAESHRGGTSRHGAGERRGKLPSGGTGWCRRSRLGARRRR